MKFIKEQNTWQKAYNLNAKVKAIVHSGQYDNSDQSMNNNNSNNKNSDTLNYSKNKLNKSKRIRNKEYLAEFNIYEMNQNILEQIKRAGNLLNMLRFKNLKQYDVFMKFLSSKANSDFWNKKKMNRLICLHRYVNFNKV